MVPLVNDLKVEDDADSRKRKFNIGLLSRENYNLTARKFDSAGAWLHGPGVRG